MHAQLTRQCYRIVFHLLRACLTFRAVPIKCVLSSRLQASLAVHDRGKGCGNCRVCRATVLARLLQLQLSWQPPLFAKLSWQPPLFAKPLSVCYAYWTQV